MLIYCQALSQRTAENLEAIRAKNLELELQLKEKNDRLQEYIQSFREKAIGKLSTAEIEAIIKRVENVK